MRRTAMALSALAMVGAVFAGCGSDDDSSGGGSSTTDGGGKAQKVAVLLPDTKSSVRWETADKPLLQKAFDDAGVPVEIQNAQGDKSAQQQQAEQAITNGAKILLLTNLDSGSGAAIESNAKSRGVKVIDYDRLTLKGSADYYVSFDNVAVGKLQGEGLAKCLADGGGGDAEHRRAQRLADGQQRDPVQAGLRLRARSDVQGRQGQEGRRPVRARLGQPAGADHLRADAAEDEQQDRRRARGQRRPGQRGHLRAQAAQAEVDPGHRPGRDARRASSTSSRATSA